MASSFNRKMDGLNSQELMMSNKTVALWAAKEVQVLPASAITAPAIVEFATQLSIKDKNQIMKGFEAGSYEMTMNYVWTKAMAALKRDLAKVGMRFLGEILGKGDFDEDTNPTSAISNYEAIMLAQELGVVSSTEAMRLRHAHEKISHFVDMEGNDVDPEESMDLGEAIESLKACVKNILGKQKVEVSTQFAEFRSALERQVFKSDASEIQNLLISPYFFRKITLGILLNLARSNKGAQLENALANLNVVLPLIWPNIHDTEKWSIGVAYSEAYSAGAQVASAGLKSALLKVQGFDFVPENVRSHTFLKAAEKLLEAHEQINNYYNEPGPVKELRALGTIIPIHAFPVCATSVMCVYLGNSYGICNAAQADAVALMESFTRDRWEYYFDKCLPNDARMLDKLLYEKPQARLRILVQKFELNKLNLTGKTKKLIDAATVGNHSSFSNALQQIRADYYGK